jgi:hypothetical protein
VESEQPGAQNGKFKPQKLTGTSSLRDMHSLQMPLAVASRVRTPRWNFHCAPHTTAPCQTKVRRSLYWQKHGSGKGRTGGTGSKNSWTERRSTTGSSPGQTRIIWKKEGPLAIIWPSSFFSHVGRISRPFPGSHYNPHDLWHCPYVIPEMQPTRDRKWRFSGQRQNCYNFV